VTGAFKQLDEKKSFSNTNCFALVLRTF